jgi:O-antigen ligase
MNLERLRAVVCVLLLIFPAVANLVVEGGSVTLVLFTLLGIVLLFTGRQRPALSAAEKLVIGAFAAYFGAYLLSFAVNGLLGNLIDPRTKHLDHEVRMLFVLPVYMAFRTLRVPPRVLWAAVWIGAAAAAVYASVSYLWVRPGERVLGSYGAISFGDLSLALAFMSLTTLSAFKDRPLGRMLIPPAACLLGLAAAVLSETRGALIAAPVLLCILYFYAAGHLKPAIRLLLVGLCIMGALAVHQLPGVRIGDRFASVYTEIAEYSRGKRVYTEVTTRLEGWRAALDMFRENPVIGAGPGNFQPLLHRLVAEGRRDKIAFPHSQPHSAYFSAMADCGLIGLSALMAMFAAPLWAARRYVKQGGAVLRDLGYSLAVLAAAFMQFGLTETIFSRNIYVSFYVIMVAAIMAAAANHARPGGADDGKRPSP